MEWQGMMLIAITVDWGDGCTYWNIYNGCEVWPGESQQTSFICTLKDNNYR